MLRMSALSLALVCSIASVISAHSTPAEPRKKEFVIANDDGYGTSDCLTKSTACGKIVADAWCESKGFARSVAYRLAERGETTQSIRAGSVQEAFVISCSE